MQDEAPVSRQLDDQPDKQHRKRHRYHELRRPGDEFDIDGTVAEIKGALEVPPGVGDEDTDDERREGRPSHLGQPQPAPLEAGHEDFHAHVRPDALHVGDGEYGEAHHRDLDDVDVPEDRRIEHRPQDDLRDAEQHQREDEHAGAEIETVLKRAEKAVGPIQAATEGVVHVLNPRSGLPVSLPHRPEYGFHQP